MKIIGSILIALGIICVLVSLFEWGPGYGERVILALVGCVAASSGTLVWLLAP